MLVPASRQAEVAQAESQFDIRTVMLLGRQIRGGTYTSLAQKQEEKFLPPLQR
jgi:hypothetical protein